MGVKRLGVIAIGVVWAAACAGLPARAEIKYRVVDLGTLGGARSEAYGINDLGQVIGWAQLPGESGDGGGHAFRTGPNQPINPATDDLDVHNSYASIARGINNHGQVAGWLFPTPNSDPQAFRSSANEPINAATDVLIKVPGFWSYGYAINDTGQVVGDAGATGNWGQAFRTAPNGSLNPATDLLGTLGGPGSVAYAINATGAVAGASFVANGSNSVHGFRVGPDTTINALTDDLGVAGGPDSAARAINASGQIAGALSSLPFNNDNATAHVFRTASNQPINPLFADLGMLGISNCTVMGMNDLGQIVGMSNVPPNALDFTAFAVLDSTILDLNDLIDSRSGWVLDAAYGINNRGQIVGAGRHDGEIRAFRLDPVPEPSSVLLFAIGATVVLLRSRGWASWT